jgi:hypothetical protein
MTELRTCTLLRCLLTCADGRLVLAFWLDAWFSALPLWRGFATVGRMFSRSTLAVTVLTVLASARCLFRRCAHATRITLGSTCLPSAAWFLARSPRALRICCLLPIDAQDVHRGGPHDGRHTAARTGLL